MIKPVLLAAVVASALCLTNARAQFSPAPADAPSIPAPTGPDAPADRTQALEPFVASYEVYRDGSRLGEATLQVVEQTAPRWRVDLTMRGTGLLKLAGINAEQSTVFEEHGETYRPLSQSTLRKTLFTRKQTVGVYDWASLSAQWRGEVRESREQPVTLQPGDMSGLLINLAVIRDAQPGRTLNYRFVDTGRTRPHRYVVAPETESVSVGELGYQAMRVARVHGLAGVTDNEETVIWVVSGVPTPIRMLQRKNGEDTYDLRLVEYTGMQ